MILGDLNAGRDYPEQEIFADGEAALDLLETAFTPAYTADYVPQCTFCITNPVREPGADGRIELDRSHPPLQSGRYIRRQDGAHI